MSVEKVEHNVKFGGLFPGLYDKCLICHHAWKSGRYVKCPYCGGVPPEE